MDSDQDMSGNDTENVSDQALEDLGMSKDMGQGESHEAEGQESAEDDGEHSSKRRPTGWERLKKKTRQQERDIQELHARIAEMQSQFQPNQQMQQPQQQSPLESGNQQQQGSGNMDMIQQAVSYALQQKEMEERRSKESEAQRHIAKQYQDLNKHLDSTADKYDDFDDLVRGEAPFTAAMRDIALTLPKKGAGSAGEVLYRLGKNPEELSRIAKLHPVDQAAELIALSHALISGGEQKQSQPRPLGQIKNNPVVNSVGVNEKTPVSDIRSRMKQGTFK